MKLILSMLGVLWLSVSGSFCGEGGTVTALSTQQVIKLDGRADDPVWKRAAELKESRVAAWLMMEDGSPAPGTHEALFAYDENYLYVIYSAATDDPESLLSLPATPEEGDCVRIEIAGASMGVDCENVRLQLLQPYLIPLNSAIARSKSGWSVEMAIPWEHVGGKPGTGKATAFNINANDTAVGRVTWAPVKDPRDTANFGKLQLEDAR